MHGTTSIKAGGLEAAEVGAGGLKKSDRLANKANAFLAPRTASSKKTRPIGAFGSPAEASSFDPGDIAGSRSARSPVLEVVADRVRIGKLEDSMALLLERIAGLVEITVANNQTRQMESAAQKAPPKPRAKRPSPNHRRPSEMQ